MGYETGKAGPRARRARARPIHLAPAWEELVPSRSPTHRPARQPSSRGRRDPNRIRLGSGRTHSPGPAAGRPTTPTASAAEPFREPLPLETALPLEALRGWRPQDDPRASGAEEVGLGRGRELVPRIDEADALAVIRDCRATGDLRAKGGRHRPPPRPGGPRPGRPGGRGGAASPRRVRTSVPPHFRTRRSGGRRPRPWAC